MKIGLGDSGLWILIWVFGWAIVWYLHYREETKKRLKVFDLIHKERLIAMEKGLPYPELPPYEMDEPEPVETESLPWKTVTGVGAAVLLTGFGCVAALLMIQLPAWHVFWPLGTIPVWIGFGLLACAWVFRRMSPQ